MLRTHVFAALLVGAAALTGSQFITPPADSTWTHKVGHAGVPVRFKQVPSGICETTDGVKSYSGYAEVEPGSHIFFWFHEIRKGDPSTAPLTIWLNGGPGSTSMYGMMSELGPCFIDKHGHVVHNPDAWNEVSNMLFIDQPIGTGFSHAGPTPGYVSDSGNVVALPSAHCPDYADPATCGTFSSPNISTTANSTQAGAENFWRAVQGFTGALPLYDRETVVLAGESYAARYLPAYGKYLLDQNSKGPVPTGTKKITLDGMIIGNGCVDPLTQFESYYKITLDSYYGLPRYNATIDAQVRNALYDPGNCLDQLKECQESGIDSVCSRAADFCNGEVEDAWIRFVGRDVYDVRELMPDPFPPSYWIDYLRTPKVQEAIGAYTNFSTNSDLVYDAFLSTGDQARGTTAALEAIIASNIDVLLHFGDADFICSIHGGIAVADKLAAPGFGESGYTRLRHASGDEAPGEVRQAGSFAFVRIYQAGHLVPYYQPRASLEIFQRLLQRKDIATGTVPISPSYRTEGPKTSDYREGNGTVQYVVVPPEATYNTTTGAPNPFNPNTTS